MPRSSSSSTVVSLDARRLEPPETLSDGARKHFLDLVDAMPATHFRREDSTLLAAYCEAASVAENAAGALAVPGGLLTDEGRMSPYFLIFTSATKTMAGLALRLRLAPQSRHAKATKKQTPPPMSYYERQRLQERRHA
jgi:phage terminase small subunit